MKPWQPMRDRVFVRRIPEPERGTIIIPEKYKDAAHIGEVVSVGPGTWVEGVNPGLVRKPLEVKPGDMIAFGRFTDYHFEDDDVVVIQEADIMFKIGKRVSIGIDKFEHNHVGVERSAGSVEAMFD